MDIIAETSFCNMENPFFVIEQRLCRIEGLIANLDLRLGEIKPSKKPDRVSEYLDTVQVSELAKVKLTTIYAYNTRGTIPIFSDETPIIYKRDEIIEWLENGKKLTPRLAKLMEGRKMVKRSTGGHSNDTQF
ncbi:MAG: DNA-binding protein [Parapedobacter sp.]|nr:MAG: DNA-binding protein [Parapedobacter sp.]